ncbi:HAD family phosphatase [Streptomyces sp. NPDC001634]|uniref:HAD family hydrolase n=1 Tax=Streptomyces sp. NPDC001634 TaxID=3154390 RepID=UPI003323E46C
MPGAKWVLFDFAGVLGLHQSERDRRYMLETAGVEASSFWEEYWRERQPYDAGTISAEEYWSRIGTRLQVKWTPPQITELIRLDVASWLRPNQSLLELVPELRASDFRLAILSNAPPELADAVEQLPWLSSFEQFVFSCRLGLTKPDVRCYEAALLQLRARPEDVHFFDDRRDNVAGAAVAGLRAFLFADPGDVGRLLHASC